MSFKSWFLIPILFLLTFSSSLAYESPGSPTGFVNDYADILTDEQETILESKLTSLSTTNGSEVAVVTIQSLQGDTIENYAVSLFAEWGIGKEGSDTGLLLLVSLEDREMRIEVGYGLEGTITDAQSYWIIHNVITPPFKNGDYYIGIDGAVDKIIEAITGGVIIPNDQSQDTTYTTFEQVIVNSILFGTMFLSIIFGYTKSFWLGGVLGLVVGFGVGMYFQSIQTGIEFGIILGIIGLIFDFLVSRRSKGGGSGFGGFGGGGGFGGFGGGSSGGGGASGKW